jgi:hypothetical protein
VSAGGAASGTAVYQSMMVGASMLIGSQELWPTGTAHIVAWEVAGHSPVTALAFGPNLRENDA